MKWRQDFPAGTQVSVDKISLYCFVVGVITTAFLAIFTASGVLVASPLWSIQIYALCSIVAHAALQINGTLHDPAQSYFNKSLKWKTKVVNVKCLLLLSCSVLLFYVFAILFGAPLLENVAETLHFGLLMAVITTLPVCFVWGSDLYTWLQITIGIGPRESWEKAFYTFGLSGMVGAWFGAFPIPLDWDRPWQDDCLNWTVGIFFRVFTHVWPITCSFGALLAYAATLLYWGITSVYTYRKNQH